MFRRDSMIFIPVFKKALMRIAGNPETKGGIFLWEKELIKNG